MMTKTKLNYEDIYPPPWRMMNRPHINKMAILRKNNNDPPFLFKNYKKKLISLLNTEKITVSNPEDISFS